MTFTGKYNEENLKHKEKKSNKSTTSNAKSEKISGKLTISSHRMEKEGKKGQLLKTGVLLTDPYTPNHTPPPPGGMKKDTYTSS